MNREKLFAALIYPQKIPLSINLTLRITGPAFDHAQQITRKAMQGMFANTTPKTPIRHPSDAVSDDLLQSILETTCVEEMARNTLVLQGLQRLMQSSKEAPNLVEDLSSAGVKVAEVGLELLVRFRGKAYVLTKAGDQLGIISEKARS